MPGKWLNWTPKTTTGANAEPSKPAEPPTDLVSAGFAGVGGYISPNSLSKNFTVPASEDEQAFPHCPRCASYALYRKNNAGNYECQTCGLTDIPEAIARRVQ